MINSIGVIHHAEQVLLVAVLSNDQSTEVGGIAQDVITAFTPSSRARYANVPCSPLNGVNGPATEDLSPFAPRATHLRCHASVIGEAKTARDGPKLPPATGVTAAHRGKRAVVKPESQTVEVHDIADLAAARHQLKFFLRRHSLPSELTYDLLTCVQEASKNALRFGATPCGVRVSVAVGSSEILVTVRDHGPGLDLSPSPEPESPRRSPRARHEAARHGD